jgi:hypothetical protein
VPFAVSRVTNNSRSLRSPAHQSAPTPKITRFKMTRFYNPVNNESRFSRQTFVNSVTYAGRKVELQRKIVCIRERVAARDFNAW